MKRNGIVLIPIILVGILSEASAQTVVRTWVSAEGSDANACTRSAPCRNFDAAIDAVSSGGEVVVLNSGGYGPVLITKSVSLISPPGVHAAIAPQAGAAIVVDTPATVVLRGLTLSSFGALTGVDVDNAGVLHIESCVISGFTENGITFELETSAKLFVIDSIIRNNGAGTARSGISISGIDTGILTASVYNCRVEANGYGIVVNQNARVTVRDTISAGNVNMGFYAIGGGSAGAPRLDIENCVASNNNDGVIAGFSPNEPSVNVSNSTVTNNTGSGIQSFVGTIRVSGSTVTHNGIGLFACCGGVLQSRGNNTVEANGTDVSDVTAFTAK